MKVKAPSDDRVTIKARVTPFGTAFVVMLSIVLASVLAFDDLLAYFQPLSSLLTVQQRRALLVAPIVLGLMVLATRDARARLRNSSSQGALVKTYDDCDKWDVRPVTRTQSLKDLHKARKGQSPEQTSRIKNYGHMIVALRGRMSHCHETYVIARNQRTRTIEATYKLSGHLLKSVRENFEAADHLKPVNLCFPVLTLKKGQLPDNLVVTCEGRQLVVTPYSEVYALQLLTLDSLFDTTFAGKPPKEDLELAAEVVSWRGSPTPCGHAADPDAHCTEPLRAACDHNKATHTILDHLRPYNSPKKHLKRSATSLHSSYLQNFISLHADSYPVCVELPEDLVQETISITIRTDAPRIEYNDGLRDWLRNALEIEPFRFRVPLTRMFLADSYHLTFRVDSSQHLFSQHLVQPTNDRNSDTRTARVSLAEISNREEYAQSHVRLESWSNLSSGRLYARGFRDTDPFMVSASLRFHERPPGTTATVSLMLLLDFILMLTFGYLASQGGLPDQLDYVAVLLAIPAISLAIIGRVRPAEANAFMPLKTRLAELAGIFLPILALLLYTLQEVGKFPSLSRVPVSILGSTLPYDYAWFVLIAVTGVLGVLITYAGMSSMVSYNLRLNRSLNSLDFETMAGPLVDTSHVT